MKSVRILMTAILAPSLFFILATAVGLAAARFYAPEHNPLAIAQQGRTEPLVSRLPSEWKEGFPKRGIVLGLTSRSGQLLAVGPGLGVYRFSKDEVWSPFDGGLNSGLDTTAISSNLHGLFVGTSAGRAYSMEGARWKLVGASPDSRPIMRITAVGRGILFSTKERTFEWIAGNSLEVTNLIGNDGALLRRLIVFESPQGNWAAAAWLKDDTSALLALYRLDANPNVGLEPPYTSPGTGTRPFISAVETTGGRLTGIYRLEDSKPLLPEEYMKFPVMDVAIRAKDGDDFGNLEILAALENIGVLSVLLRDGQPVETKVLKAGLPIEPVTCLNVLAETIYAGTEGKGVYRLSANDTVFEPVNAGLMFLQR